MGEITITQEKYEALLIANFEYDILLKCIFKSMDLSWRKEHLVIRNDDDIIEMLKMLNPTRVDATYRVLKQKDEMKRAAENESDAEQEVEECSES